MHLWASVIDAIERHGRCALISVADIRGSAPREPGARIVLGPDGSFRGTIGGGELEWQAIAAARSALRAPQVSASLCRFTLGPDLGQCCGGSVRLLTEVFDASRLGELAALAAREQAGAFVSLGHIASDTVTRKILETAPGEGRMTQAAIVLEGESQIVEHFAAAARSVLLFGAGHVGRALMLALAPLPFALRWIDSRADAFPGAVAANVRLMHSANPVQVLDDAAQGAFVIVMTHSHALDLAIVHAALVDGRFDYVGLIGSKSKRARFVHRLRGAGVTQAQLAALVCPIGIGEIRSKLPAAIAAAVAAELLARDEACAPALDSQASVDTLSDQPGDAPVETPVENLA